MTTAPRLPVPAARTLPAMPAADLLAELTAILAGTRHLESQAVDGALPFALLGLDSLLAAEFVSAVNARYGTRITPEALVRHPTPEALARHLAAELAAAAPAPARPPGGGSDAVLTELRAQLAAVLRCRPEDIDVTTPVTALGLDSILIAEFMAGLNRTFGLHEQADLFYDHPDLVSVAGYVGECLARRTGIPPTAAPRPAPAAPAAPAPAAPPAVPAHLPGQPEPLAIVGLHGRFARADDLDAFWRAALDGRPTDGPVPSGRPGGGTGRGHLLERPEEFDPELFGLDPARAALTDPQERLLLHTVWELLETTGHAGPRLDALGADTGRPRDVGCYVAVGSADYALLAAARPEPAPAVTAGFGLAGRLSALLDLHGPSQVVDTGESSFLTALHQAAAALRARECAAALVCAAELRLHPSRQWPGAGEGVAALLLKPLDAALADGDDVHAVLRASTVDHPGRTGTGGPAVPGAPTVRESPETVADQVGDAGAATGAAVLVRAVLQLRHRTLLPDGGRTEPLPWNPAAGPDGTPLPRQAAAAAGGARQARAAVLLEEAPAAAVTAPAPEGDGPELVLLSAPTPAHLAATAARLADWLTDPDSDPSDRHLPSFARELRNGRAAMDCRLAVIAHDPDELAAALAEFAVPTVPAVPAGPAAARSADLRGTGEPLLLADLPETLAWVDALWAGGRLEQLARLWLAGSDVRGGAAPGPRTATPPATATRPRALWFDGPQ